MIKLKLITITLFVTASFALGGCTSFGEREAINRLKGEISQLNSQIAEAESLVRTNTSELAAVEGSIATRVNYTGLKKLTDQFSLSSSAARTMRFEQTSFSGDIERVSMRCRWNFQRSGRRVRFARDDASEITLRLERMDLVGEASGFSLSIPARLRIRSAVQAREHIACTGGPSPWLGVTARGDASPNFTLQAEFQGIEGNEISYVTRGGSQNDIDVDVLAFVTYFPIAFETQIDSDFSELEDGEIQLPIAEKEEVILPDGSPRIYVMRYDNHQLQTDLEGFSVSADLNISIGGDVER